MAPSTASEPNNCNFSELPETKFTKPILYATTLTSVLSMIFLLHLTGDLASFAIIPFLTFQILSFYFSHATITSERMKTLVTFLERACSFLIPVLVCMGGYTRLFEGKPGETTAAMATAIVIVQIIGLIMNFINRRVVDLFIIPAAFGLLITILSKVVSYVAKTNNSPRAELILVCFCSVVGIVANIRIYEVKTPKETDEFTANAIFIARITLLLFLITPYFAIKNVSVYDFSMGLNRLCEKIGPICTGRPVSLK